PRGARRRRVRSPPVRSRTSAPPRTSTPCRLPTDTASAPPLHARGAATPSPAGRPIDAQRSYSPANPFIELTKQLRHVQRGGGRFSPLVPRSRPRPLHRLLLGHRRQHS